MNSKRMQTCCFIMLTLLSVSAFNGTINGSVHTMNPTRIPINDNLTPSYGHGHVHAHYVSSPMDSPYLYAHKHVHEHPHEHVYTTSPVILHPFVSMNKTEHTTNDTKAETNSATINKYQKMSFLVHTCLCYMKLYL